MNGGNFADRAEDAEANAESRAALALVTAPVNDVAPQISFAAVMHSQLPWIRRRLRSLFPAHLDLDELEQQVLLNLLRSLPGYRGEGSIRAWVDRITVRVGIKHARRVRSRERSELALLDVAREVQQFSTTSTTEADFSRGRLQTLLSAVSAEQKRALILHHVVGLTVAEIAQHQGVPTETARSRLRVAMQKLRRRARLARADFR